MRERARSSFRVNYQTTPDSPRCHEKVDVDYMMMIPSDGFHGYTLNGMIAALIVEA
jgi:hypothetical protein